MAKAQDDRSETLDVLEQTIGARIDRLASGEALSEDPVGELLKLARAATTIANERRQKAKAEKRSIVALSPAAILTWFREQTPEARAKVLREVTAIDAPSKRSVLA